MRYVSTSPSKLKATSFPPKGKHSTLALASWRLKMIVASAGVLAIILFVSVPIRLLPSDDESAMNESILLSNVIAPASKIPLSQVDKRSLNKEGEEHITVVEEVMSDSAIKDAAPIKKNGVVDQNLSVLAQQQRLIVERMAQRMRDPKMFYAVPQLVHPPADAVVMLEDSVREFPFGRLFLDTRFIVNQEMISENSENFALYINLAFTQVVREISGASISALKDIVLPEELRGSGKIINLCHTLIGLDMGSSDLVTLPLDFATTFPAVEILFLTGNLITKTPKVLSNMNHLSRLSLKSNQIKLIDPLHELPLSSLVHLILTENGLTTFRSSLFRANKMRKLMIAGNNLDNIDSIFIPSYEPERYSSITSDIKGGVALSVDVMLQALMAQQRCSPVPQEKPDEQKNETSSALGDAGKNSSAHSPDAPSQPQSIFDSLELLRMTRNLIPDLFTAPGDQLVDKDGRKIKKKSGWKPTPPRLSVDSVTCLFKNLKWVSYAGNPATSGGNHSTKASSTAAKTETMIELLLRRNIPDLSELIDASFKNPLVKILGQGTSGIVKQCPVVSGGAVAVKFFKRVSSDGSGEDECYALAHLPSPSPPSLLAPCGFVQYSLARAIEEQILPLSVNQAGTSPEALREVAQQEFYTFYDGDVVKIVAMVFPLVDAKPLGKSPNVWTATDDVFDASTEFPFPNSMSVSDRIILKSLFLLKVSLGITIGLDSMHEVEIQVAHGDVYAHNIFFGVVHHTELTHKLESHQNLKTVHKHQSEDLVLKKVSALIAQIAPEYERHEALLSDFGAAFLYNNHPANANTEKKKKPPVSEASSSDVQEATRAARPPQHPIWERVETRSLGTFINDLQTYVFPTPESRKRLLRLKMQNSGNMHHDAARGGAALQHDDGGRVGGQHVDFIDVLPGNELLSVSAVATLVSETVDGVLSEVIQMCASNANTGDGAAVLAMVRNKLKAAGWQIAEHLSK